VITIQQTTKNHNVRILMHYSI